MELLRDGATALYGLDEESSFDLLDSTSSGRVAVNGLSAPSVFPVQYSIDGRAIVFRANRDLRRQIEGQGAVTFQADGYDDDRDVAWSVTAQGAVEQMRDLGSLEVPVGFSPAEREPWAVAEDLHWVRIVPELVVGVLSTGDVVDLTD